MSRSACFRWVVGVALVAMLGMSGLAGCARGDAGSASDTGAPSDVDLTELSWEAQALESIGFSPQDLAVADPAPVPTMSPGERDGRRLGKYHRLRFAFGRRVLHGEAVVQTEDGTRTVVVQRGTVTAIDADSVTVKSADGFTLTWVFDDPLHVVEHRSSVQPSAIAVGTQVGVAGHRQGDTTLARLIVVPGVRR